MAAEKDHDAEVLKFSRLYNAEQWLQPRSLVQVQLAKLKEETRCPMCFGKIRDARISMVCLHRYCAKCIEQYLRAKVPGRHGDDKECPVCRAHLHSRRATKPDPGFDKIIKALYGDVDQFDAEEEALIAADNKRHVAQWQAQLADMKARQAAAVAAARSGSTALGAALLERRSAAAAAAAARDEGRAAAAAAHDGLDVAEQARAGMGIYRPGSANMGPAAGRPHRLGGAAGGAAGAVSGGLGSRKRSWVDLNDEQQLRGSSKAAHYGGERAAGRSKPAAGSSAGGRAGRAGSNSWQKAALLPDLDEDEDADAALMLAALQQQPPAAGVKRERERPAGAQPKLEQQQQQLGAAGVSGSHTLMARSSSSSGKKKKRSAREVAARLLGLAARAAAAAGPQPRCCLVHLEPAIKPLAPVQPAGGGRKSRGYGGSASSSSAALLQQQRAVLQAGSDQLYVCPPVDQPYLACPLDLTVACLKGLVLQQLRQQSLSGLLSAAAAPLQLQQLQLLLPQSGPGPAAGDSSAADESTAADAGASVLRDELTVGQLHAIWQGVGPEVPLKYRLLKEPPVEALAT